MSWAMTSLMHTPGYELIAVVCLLILLEEVGIPMPFMPGDFLLVVAGMAITTSHLNPFVVAPAAYLAGFLGATGGRELFARLGQPAVAGIAHLLHAGERVHHLSGKLRRGGSVAVFFGRITPGMRQVTTYMSGLTRLPRRTYLLGLAPGIAVYDAVFLGIGAWLGPTAWATIERNAPTPGQMMLALMLLGGLVAFGHFAAGRLQRRSGVRKSAIWMVPLG